jgi:hypothetical protein
MLPSLDNFVSDVPRARPDYRQKALDIYITALSSDHLGENDRVNGLQSSPTRFYSTCAGTSTM